MKIAMMINSLSTGGAETALKKLALEYKHQNMDVLIVTLHDSRNYPIYKEVVAADIKVVSLYSNTFSTVKELFQFKPDIIQSWLVLSNIIAFFLNIFLKSKLIWSVRQSLNKETIKEPKTNFMINSSKPLSPYVDTIVYNSHQGKHDHELYGYYNENSLVIPNGFTQINFTEDEKLKILQSYKVSSTNFKIIFCGRDHVDKGYQYFYQAARKLYSENSNVSFIMCGPGMDTKSQWYHDLSDQEKLDFHFLGNINNPKQLYTLIAACDLFTSSSLTEAFSNSIGEAIFSGTLAMVTDVGDSARIVNNPQLVIEPGNSDFIYKKWKEIIDLGSHEREQLLSKAKMHCTQNYEFKNVAQSYIDTYKRLVDEFTS